MTTETDYKTEAPGANGYGTTVGDLDDEVLAMKVIVNALDAIRAELAGLEEGRTAVLHFLDDRYQRATQEFRPAKVERAIKVPGKLKVKA